MNFVRSIPARVIALYRAYPARSNALIASALVFAALKVGVVVDQQSVAASLAAVLPILLAGQATHRKVSPVEGE